MPGTPMPAPGHYLCQCISAVKGKSFRKGTPLVHLIWSTTGGETIEDDLYITPKTLSRLNLVAQRVCGMSKEHKLSDDDAEAADMLAGFIVQNARDKSAVVTIDETEEEFIPTDGPNMGVKQIVKKRRVAFAGYRTPEDRDTKLPEPSAKKKAASKPDEGFEVDDSEIPF